MSERALRLIVASADLSPHDAVVEIGPGLGTLTAALARCAGTVTALEVDRRLLPVLSARFAGVPSVRIVQGDALHADLEPLFADWRIPPGRPAGADWRIPPASPLAGPGRPAHGNGAPRKVVGNLPYNIAAPLLLRLLDPALRVARLVVTVQREVAERIAARPGSGPYGRLSAVVQYRAAAQIVARIPPGAFLPPPDVESAVLTLIPHPSPPVRVEDEEALFRVIAAGFGHRRKTLANALAHGLNLSAAAVDAACRAAGIDPRVRAEALGLDAFAALTGALSEAESLGCARGSAEDRSARRSRGRGRA